MPTIPHTFAVYPPGNFPASDWDANWSFLGSLTNIYCTATGTNAVVLTPAATSPAVAALQTNMLFWWVQPTTTTGATSIQVSGQIAYAAYNASGVALTAGMLLGGTLYAAAFDPTLNAGVGGFRVVSILSAASLLFDIEIIIDGGGATITTGQKGHLTVPFPAVILGWTLLLDQSSTTQVNVWKSTFAGFPPNAGNAITGASPPATVTAQKAQGGVGGWTTALAQGDILAFNVDSNSAAQRATLSLQCQKA